MTHRLSRNLLAAGVIVPVLAAGCGVAAAQAPEGKILASVNGRNVTQQSWKVSMDAIAMMSGQAPPTKVTTQQKYQEVKELMNWAAIQNWTISHHWDTTAQAAKAATSYLSQIESQAGGSSQLTTYLKEYQLTLPAFKTFLDGQELLQTAYNRVTKQVKPPTVAAERAFYKKNLASFKNPATVKVRDIEVKTRVEAAKLETEIKSGQAKFAALAKKDSLDTTTKSSGGEIGTVQKGAASGQPQPVYELMDRLKVGQYGIAHANKAYYLIEVQKVTPASTTPFSSSKVKSEIKSALVSQADSKAFQNFGIKVEGQETAHLYIKK